MAASALPECAAVIAVTLVPGVLLSAAALGAMGLTTPEALTSAYAVGDLARLLPSYAARSAAAVLSLWGFAATVFALQARQAGGALSPREALGRALARLIPFALTELLVVFLVILGCALLLIPGLLVAARYSLAHLAALLEGIWGRAALSRSRDLMAKDFWGAAGRLAAALIITVVLAWALALAADAVVSLPRLVYGASASLLESQLSAFIRSLTASLAGLWLTSVSLILYKDLSSG